VCVLRRQYVSRLSVRACVRVWHLKHDDDEQLSSDAVTVSPRRRERNQTRVSHDAHHVDELQD